MAGLVVAQAAQACQICVPFPTKSAADYLIEADAVALAREDPARPFYYSVVEVLKGDPGSEPIDLFVDSSTRRVLAAYPDRSVVLVRSTEDGEAGWRRIGLADEQTGPLVREVLALAPLWDRTPRRRVEYFGKLLGHENPQVRTIAHLEVGRAPYGEIKRLGDVLSRDAIHAFLKEVRYVEWHALYILLLAQSGDERDHDTIRQSFRSASRFATTTRLAAWATALIELDGEKAIDLIDSEYFGDRERGAKELEEISKALSVHGSSGHTHLRERIVASYGKLLVLAPAMTPKIADDLIAWKRTELASEIAAYMAANPRRFDFQTTMRLRAYVRAAGE